MIFFLMQPQPPRSTRTGTLCPNTALFRSPWSGSREKIFSPNDLEQMICCFRSGPESANGKHTTPVNSLAVRSTLTLKCRRSSLGRSEEHTSELQSLMRISYAVYCLKKKTQK